VQIVAKGTSSPIVYINLEFEFFFNNLLGAMMISFHVSYQDSYIAMSDSSPIIDIQSSPAILVQSFYNDMDEQKSLKYGAILLS
jgi:hypothetical protein